MHIYDNKWKYLANSLNGNKKQENKHNNKEVLEDKISGHKHCRVCQKSNYKFASSISYKQVKTSFQAYHRSIKKQIRVAGRRRRSIPAIPAASPQTE